MPHRSPGAAGRARGLLLLAIGLIKTIARIRVLLEAESFSRGFTLVVTDILTFLVIIELSKGFVDFFKPKRFSLHSMLDPAILFVIREMSEPPLISGGV